MVKRGFLTAAVICVMLLQAAFGELAWVTDTPGQQRLKTYIETANEYLEKQGEMPVNRIFELYPGIATLGIVRDSKAEAPEDVEITVSLLNDRMNILQLRVSDGDRFPAIAASMIMALYRENITEEAAIAVPADRAEQAKKEPKNSFVEEYEELSGSIPRFYYAYYPDQYHDGKNWLQMTMIFPMDSEWKGSDMIIGNTYVRGIDPESGVSEDYEGYYSDDEFTHFEVFATATPEPDSAAAEYDFR